MGESLFNGCGGLGLFGRFPSFQVKQNRALPFHLTATIEWFLVLPLRSLLTKYCESRQRWMTRAHRINRESWKERERETTLANRLSRWPQIEIYRAAVVHVGWLHTILNAPFFLPCLAAARPADPFLFSSQTVVCLHISLLLIFPFCFVLFISLSRFSGYVSASTAIGSCPAFFLRRIYQDAKVRLSFHLREIHSALRFPLSWSAISHLECYFRHIPHTHSPSFENQLSSTSRRAKRLMSTHWFLLLSTEESKQKWNAGQMLIRFRFFVCFVFVFIFDVSSVYRRLTNWKHSLTCSKAAFVCFVSLKAKRGKKIYFGSGSAMKRKSDRATIEPGFCRPFVFRSWLSLTV